MNSSTDEPSLLKKIMRFFSNLLNKFSSRFLDYNREHKLQKSNLDENHNDIGFSIDSDESLEEDKLISEIRAFSNSDITQTIIPAAHLIAVNYSDSLDNIVERFIQTSITRMPVYKLNMDNIVGFVHVKDVLQYSFSKGIQFDIADVLRPVLYVPRSVRCADLLHRMRLEIKHVAAVFDENGCIEGITTIETLLEKIFGDIADEHNKQTTYSKIQKISENEYILDATLSIEDAEECFNEKDLFSQEDGEYNTIGGFILAHLDRIPAQGEGFIYNSIKEHANHSSATQYQFNILSADERKINVVRITRIA